MNWQTSDKDPTPAEESLLSISDVVERTGLSARTLRYYEELGLLPGVRRRAGGRRVYGEDELERLAFIQRLKALGLSLGEIKELNAVYAIEGSTHAMLVRLASLLEAHLHELDDRIFELKGLRAVMGSYQKHISLRGATGEDLDTGEGRA